LIVTSSFVLIPPGTVNNFVASLYNNPDAFLICEVSEVLLASLYETNIFLSTGNSDGANCST
jgi:hypothetical protein